MRQKKAWRYYCDHCNKAGGHAGHMRTHEQHCTSNPFRACRMCGKGSHVVALESQYLGTDPRNPNIETLREMTNG